MSRILFNDPLPEPERYELAEKPRYRFELDRRTFLQLTGAGLLITVTGGAAFAQRGASGARTIAARIHIGEDGIVTVMTSKVEVGQGARTELAQAAAEELRVPVDRVRMIMADTDVVPDDGGTYGSLTTPRTVPLVREAAAAAREALVQLAASVWQAPAGEVIVADAVIAHPPTSRRITFGELAKQPALLRLLEAPVEGAALTGEAAWTTLGAWVKKTTGRDIVTGAQKYPSDLVRPGMRYGAVLRPPAAGARLKHVDLALLKEWNDVVTVQDGDFVACAAPTSFRAAQAIAALQKTAVWEGATAGTTATLFAGLKQNAKTEGRGRSGPRVDEEGEVDAAFSAQAVTRAVYNVSYIQHVPMEPRAAVAEWVEGKLTVWTGTQRPHGVLEELQEAFGLGAGMVRVIVPDSGGGFGGKHTGDAALEAARIAKAAQAPVSLRWTREEEFQWAYCRPAGVIEMAAVLKEGALHAWEHSNINSGAAAIEMPYAAPHWRTRFLPSESPLREGSYRALAGAANVFARESFIDELALEAGADPLAFRLKHVQDDRLRAVLEAAASKFDWMAARQGGGSGTGVGIACGMLKGSYVATAVRVRVDNAIHVEHVCQAFECGAILNPGNLRSQVEGCIIMGLGGALLEAVEFEEGRVLNASLKQYAVPRFEHVPPLDLVLLDRRDLPSAGAGETPIVGIAPAIANAVCHATGRRLRQLPLRLEG
ncbi:MAG: xanthine dehydrogenase family protein molybdopterin-binding subunit [Candidatus Hydrogenedentes bacterium]|nr:xanthine dehydrogenase family protein molybdopterin-binding subunit [Candidatus Hydrogenedentota bacterium]